jgi:hypothetical protein
MKWFDQGRASHAPQSDIDNMQQFFRCSKQIPHLQLIQERDISDYVDRAGFVSV